MSLLILVVLLILVSMAGYIFAGQFFLKEGEAERLQALGVKAGPRETKSLLLRLSRPFIHYIMQFTQAIPFPEWRRKRQRDLLAAAMTEEITIDELLAYKFFMTIVALLLLLAFLPGAAWWAYVLAATIGFFFPDRWLSDRVKRRAKEVTKALPDVVDMLALSVEAGLDFVAAINKVVRKSRPGALILELQLVINEMRVGSSRADALRNMAYRCNIRELSAFVSILVQADKLGVSIGKVLRSQSDRMRSERFQKAERMGAEASQKILFPLVLCIMPAVFIIFFGPLIVRFLTGTLL